jgi:hypothetical protein
VTAVIITAPASTPTLVTASVAAGGAHIRRLAAASSEAVVSTVSAAAVVVSVSIPHTAAITLSALVTIGVSISPIRLGFIFGTFSVRALWLLLWVLSRSIEQCFNVQVGHDGRGALLG